MTPQTSPHDEPTLDAVADQVYAYVQPDGGWCLNNAGVVIGETDAVVIDTAATARRSRQLRNAIAGLTDIVPRIVVNTHFHGDHTFGNFAFAPEAIVVAHELARSEMALADLGLAALWPDVEWGDIRIKLPVVTYRDQMTLHVGERRLELFHPGPAHTITDTVVWIPDGGVLFAGDIVMNGATPFCLMGSVTGSLRSIERLRALSARVVVPGHGPVGGPELLDQTEEYLRWIQSLARAGLRAGRTPLQTAREAELGTFADLLDAERIVANLHRAYAEEQGASPGAELNVLAVFQEMVEHHGGLPSCHV
ncbi:MBL fold metallo-hydrolase [Micromonospora sp. LOL_023]|uniref:MBL fold metallo-hydrolase n=1 Tax=Micromonospora sp. LOL_023 TaxID=3345418 RepID=UPI003A85E168